MFKSRKSSWLTITLLFLTVLIAFGPYFVLKSVLGDLQEAFGGDSSLWNDVPVISWGAYEDVIDAVIDLKVYDPGREIAESVVPEHASDNPFDVAEYQSFVIGIVTSLWLFPLLFGVGMGVQSWWRNRSRQFASIPAEAYEAQAETGDSFMDVLNDHGQD